MNIPEVLMKPIQSSEQIRKDMISAFHMFNASTTPHNGAGYMKFKIRSNLWNEYVALRERYLSMTNPKYEKLKVTKNYK